MFELILSPFLVIIIYDIILDIFLVNLEDLLIFLIPYMIMYEIYINKLIKKIKHRLLINIL